MDSIHLHHFIFYVVYGKYTLIVIMLKYLQGSAIKYAEWFNSDEGSDSGSDCMYYFQISSFFTQLFR